MTTLSTKELSPVQCLQFRERGILWLIVQQLHEHTFEDKNKSEADLNLDVFLSNFNRNSGNRKWFSRKIRTIVQHTAKNESELKMCDCLEAIRTHTEVIYRFISQGNATEFPDISDPPHEEFSDLIELTNDKKNQPIFELFGGVFVILDLLRAFIQTYKKALQTGLFVRPQHQLNYAFQILNNLFQSLQILNPNSFILFLGDCRSFYEHLVIIINVAYDNNDLVLVRRCCDFIHQMSTFCRRDDKRLSYFRDCGVLESVTKLIARINDPETLFSVLQTVNSIMSFNRDSILEFCLIENSIETLIHVLVNREKKSMGVDVMNGQLYTPNVYDKQRDSSSDILQKIFLNFGTNNEQLLTNFESRDIPVKLLDYLKVLDPIIFSDALSSVIRLLAVILRDSENMRNRFFEAVGAIETVKKFQRFSDGYIAAWAQKIII